MVEGIYAEVAGERIKELRREADRERLLGAARRAQPTGSLRRRLTRRLITFSVWLAGVVALLVGTAG